jgi:MFS family permease
MLTDRVGARTMMLVADVARCVLLGVLVVLAARHSVSLLALGPVAALVGAGEGLYIPASYTIMPSLLEPGQLAAGNGLSLAAVRAGSLAGPALGGALVAAVGSAPAFGVDAGSFAVSALTLAFIPGRRAVVAAKAKAKAKAKAGGAGDGQFGVLDLLRRSRAMQMFVVVTIVANLASGAELGVALPDLAHGRFGATGYGALLACLAAGGLAGTLLAARAGKLRKPTVVAVGGFVVQAVATCLIPYLGGEVGAAVMLLIFGVCNGLGNAILFTAGQRWTPPYVLGRVMGLMMMCMYGSYPLSVALGGLVVHHTGAALFFPIAGVVTGLAFLGGLSQQQYRDFGSVKPDGTSLLAGLKNLNGTATVPATATATASAATASAATASAATAVAGTTGGAGT